jgi:hypothetical protein
MIDWMVVIDPDHAGIGLWDNGGLVGFVAGWHGHDSQERF